VYDCMGNNGKAARHYFKDGKEYDIALLDAYQTTKIHHNRFHHDNPCIHSWGIDLDDGSSNYEIYENLCLGIGIKLREGFERKVHHNLVVDGQMNMHCTYYGAKDQIYGNLFVHAHPWAMSALGEDEVQRLKDAELYVDRNGYFCCDTEVTLPALWDKVHFDKNSICNIDPGLEVLQENNYRITNEKVLQALEFPAYRPITYGKTDCSFRAPAYKIPGRQSNAEAKELLWRGAVITDIDVSIMSATATAGTDGIFFKKVPQNSPAYEMGYRTNQILKSLNGQTIKNTADFFRIAESNP